MDDRKHHIKIKALLFFLVALSLLGCQSQSEKQLDSSVSDDDYKIINSTFVHLVSQAPLGFEADFGYDNYTFKGKGFPEEHFRPVYFTRYLVSFNDSLAFSSKSSISDDTFSRLVDEDFKALGRALITEAGISLKLETALIQNIGLNRLIPVEIGQRVEREIGEKIITYSRIVYNAKKDKACFYFENNCSGLCGSAIYIFVQKEKGIWVVKEKLVDWVS